jgi:thiopeptide-type bacteriocin biosynthesis protein
VAGARRASVEHELRRRLSLINAAIAPADRIDRMSYRTAVAAVAAAGENGRSLPMQALRRGGLYPAGYEPEYDRYGGPELMSRSDALFATASELAVRLLAERRDGAAGTLLGTGLYCTASALAALGGDLAAKERFLRVREEFWLSWSAGGGAAVDPAAHRAACLAEAERLAAAPDRVLRLIDRPAGPARAWSEQLGAAVETWRAASATLPAAPILSSHLHMIHNRLGIGIRGELHVTGVLADFLRLVGRRGPARADAAGAHGPPHTHGDRVRVPGGG